MIFKKKYILLTFLLVIIIQILLSTNNKKMVSFRYFQWAVQEVSIGKLISISFFSGLFISAFLNTAITGFKKNTFKDAEENYEPLSDEEDIQSNVEIPPQRDIRDSQPTISVNYRVVQNGEENFSKSDQKFSNKPDDKNDWVNDDDDW
tara:strand:+ start:1382 stop:1825 length:444 start_codon:yes stop_codon:yes gene_type:complete